MKWFLLVSVIFFYSFPVVAQLENEHLLKYLQQKFPDPAGPTYSDSLYQLSLPELTLPESLKSASIPAMVDNSRLPYLRPVFEQVGASCGQSSAIGYNFTYEMDLARGVHADTSINQYPTHFTYNFENTGYEYYGASYFHSFDILKKCGNMNVKDYGGFTDNGSRWISGYNLYYKGMFNRIEDVYTIKTNTSRGILALKNWVYNHMGESALGGVASFYAGSPWNAKTLASGTPEQGRYVVTEFSVPAVHAMTIVGYNDSIRYDYNSDGKYTNNLDINSDGIIDVRDWEIGGFKFVNSYGNSSPGSLDSGFCYVMYHTMAEDYDHGGIWNDAVHVVKVKPGYSPLLTMKVRLTHQRRVLLRVRAGVSSDPTSLVPEHFLDIPIFNFQGGNFPMQGPGSSDTLRTIEFGLDITPLLSYIQPDKEAAFFLAVDEDDPYSQADGSIDYFSVIDYSISPPYTYACQQTPMEIADNDLTIARVLLATNTNKVEISIPDLPPFIPGQPYAVQLSASGGQPPYAWSLKYDYAVLKSNQPLPFFDGTKLLPSQPSDSVVPVALGFSFPFYGKKYDTVYVNMNNGYLQFTPDKIPWPYLNEENLLLQSYQLIVPLTNQNLNAYSVDEGAWYKSDTTSARFRWKLSKKQGEATVTYEFQASLFPDGRIIFNNGYIPIASGELFHSGISGGDKQNFNLAVYYSEYDANLYNQAEYVPVTYPADLKISNTGLAECVPLSGKTIFTIPCRVSDYRNISNEKSLLISAGIIATLSIHAGNDSILHNGDQVSADLVLTNLTSTSFVTLTAKLSISDNFVSLADSVEAISNLAPNSKLIIPGAFRFNTLSSAPDGQTFLMKLALRNNGLLWGNSLATTIQSPRLKSLELKSDKPGHELIQPGELGGIRYKAGNIGHNSAQDVEVRLRFLDSGAQLVSNESQMISEITPGQKPAFIFQVKISDSIALGTLIPVQITLTSENKVQLIDTLHIRIGRVPVMVIDLDPDKASAPLIWQTVKDLGYLADYKNLITSEMNEYQSVFISLGESSKRHILSYSEAMMLTDYLDQGGNIYLESRNIWRDDLLTSLQPRFNILTINKLHIYDTITASAGSFTEGMRFTGAHNLVSFYYIHPLWEAFSLFTDGDFTCSVANDAGTYKTIGCLFGFSAFLGINPASTQPNLMQKYLDFFQIKRNSVGINETATNALPGTVYVYPNPAIENAYLAFSLHETASVTATISDLTGRHIANIQAKNISPNVSCTLKWDLTDYSGQKVKPGLYSCRIVSAKEVLFGKIIVK